MSSIKSIISSLMSEHKFPGEIPDFFLLSFPYLLGGENLALEGFPLELSVKLIDLFVFTHAQYFHKSWNLTLVCFGSNTRTISKIPDLKPGTWVRTSILPIGYPVLDITPDNLEKQLEDKTNLSSLFKGFSVTLILFQIPDLKPHISIPDNWQIIAIPPQRCENPCGINTKTFLRIAKSGEVTKIERIKVEQTLNSKEDTKIGVSNAPKLVLSPFNTVPLPSHSNLSIFLSSLLRSRTNLIIQHLFECTAYINHFLDKIELKLNQLQVIVHGNSPSVAIIFRKCIATGIRNISTFYFAGGEHSSVYTYVVNNNIQLLFISTQNLHSSLRTSPMLLRYCKVIMGLAIEESDSKLSIQELNEIHQHGEVSAQCIAITSGGMEVDWFMGRPYYHLEVSKDVGKDFTVTLHH